MRGIRKKNSRERNDDSPVPAEDAPANWDELCGKNNHGDARNERDDERDTETGDDLRHLLPEVGALDFLFRRTPRDVVGEQVSEKGLREMDAQAAEEEEAVTRRERERAVLLVQA